MSRRAPNYDRKLTRRIDDGTRIVTLRDAADLFAERFATVTSWRLPELPLLLLTINPTQPLPPRE